MSATTLLRASLTLSIFLMSMSGASAQEPTACPADFDCFGFENNTGGDRLCGTDGTDSRLWGTAANERLCGRQGDDIISGEEGDDLVNGNQGDDIVQGSRGNDFVRGGQGDDEVRGGKGEDEVYGDEGSDNLWGDLGDDKLDGGPGDDTFHYRAGDGEDVVSDSDGRNTLRLYGLTEDQVEFNQVDDQCLVNIIDTEAPGSITFLSQDCQELETIGANAPCIPDGTTLCLNNDRFQIKVEWSDFDGQEGSGRVVLNSDDSGLFWFFDAENWEMLVKVVNGCGANQHYWVFAAATTNVEYTVTVTDPETGAMAEYHNPLGRSSEAITDTMALAACP